jgi:hypothetical protein
VRNEQFALDQKDVRFDTAKPIVQRIEQRPLVQVIVVSVRA